MLSGAKCALKEALKFDSTASVRLPTIQQKHVSHQPRGLYNLHVNRQTLHEIITNFFFFFFSLNTTVCCRWHIRHKMSANEDLLLSSDAAEEICCTSCLAVSACRSSSMWSGVLATLWVCIPVTHLFQGWQWPVRDCWQRLGRTLWKRNTHFQSGFEKKKRRHI